jgi:hypothetical protein
MGRRKKVVSPNAHLYRREEQYTMPDGRVIEKDEVIKIHGEWGGKFKFQEHVVRVDTGVEWIDCFQLEKGILCGWRSFRPDKIKPMPIRKRRSRNKGL